MMNQYPDSALIILRSLDAAELDTDADRAKYSLLYSQALDKNHIDIKSDSLISYAVEYYDRVGDDANSAKAYYYLGCVYENADDFYAAARAYVEAKNYVHAVDDDYLRGLIYFRMGALYDWQCNIDERSRHTSRHSTVLREPEPNEVCLGHTYRLSATIRQRTT